MNSWCANCLKTSFNSWQCSSNVLENIKMSLRKKIKHSLRWNFTLHFFHLALNISKSKTHPIAIVKSYVTYIKKDFFVFFLLWYFHLPMSRSHVQFDETLRSFQCTGIENVIKIGSIQQSFLSLTFSFRCKRKKICQIWGTMQQLTNIL